MDRADRIARAARHVVEALERRLLLATDLVYAATSPLNATLFNTGAAIELIQAPAATVLQSVPLTAFSGNVAITGSAGDDAVTFDPSLSALILGHVAFQGGAGDNAVTFAGDLSTFGGDVAIAATSITVDANAVRSTPLFGSVESSSEFGNISFAGTSIQMLPGSSLDTSATPGSGFASGAITLAAADAPTQAGSLAEDLLSPVLADDRTATITLTGAKLTGGGVTVSAEAETQTRWGDLGVSSSMVADSLFDTLRQESALALSKVTPISGQVKIENATAQTPSSRAGPT